MFLTAHVIVRRKQTKSLENLGESLVSQLVVLLSDLKVFDICWKSDMVGCKLAGAFFEDIRFNFLIQALEGSNTCDI